MTGSQRASANDDNTSGEDGGNRWDKPFGFAAALVKDNPRKAAGFLGAFLGAVTMLLPPCLTYLSESLRLRSELVVKVIETTATLDPIDPKSVARWGLVAELLGGKDLFSLNLEKAQSKLENLSVSLQESGILAMQSKLEASNTQIAGLTRVNESLLQQIAATHAQQAQTTADEQDTRERLLRELEANQLLLEKARVGAQEDGRFLQGILEQLVSGPKQREPLPDQRTNASSGCSLAEVAEALERVRRTIAPIPQLCPARARDADQIQLARLLKVLKDSLREFPTIGLEQTTTSIRIAGLAAFDSGQARLRPAVKKTLGKLASAISKLDGIDLQVVGHTDCMGRGNWALSSRRAVSVLEFLTRRSSDVTDPVSIDRVSMQAYADTRPLSHDCSLRGLAQNRRVELVLTPRLDEKPPSKASAFQVTLGGSAPVGSADSAI